MSSRDKAIQQAISKRKSILKMDDNLLFEQLIKGGKKSLSQAITLVESTNPEHRERAGELLRKCLPYTGKSFRLGITGVPGVGKSTFIEQFGLTLIQKGYKPAVLAIDPTSGKTGGSILGDKTRMEELGKREEVFIRPSPTSESLGGVAQKTRESMMLCEAAGYDFIIVETVGVGQSETQVHSMCDFFLLLMLAGAGDELQGIKRGIMEMADALLITKADLGNENNAIRASKEYRNALHLFPANENDWIPYIGTCSSLEKRGMERVLTVIEEFKQKQLASGWLENNRRTQNLKWFDQALMDGWKTLLESGNLSQTIKEKRKKIKEGKENPFLAAEEILNQALN